MKVRGLCPQIITPKPAWYSLFDSLRVLVRQRQAWKCLQITPYPSIKSYEIKKSQLTQFSADLLTDRPTDWPNNLPTHPLTHPFTHTQSLTDWLTDWLTCLLTYLLMPSDKHNSRMAGARDLISSLINVASSRDEPFHQPQQLQCLHRGVTFEPLCTPILSSQPHVGDNLRLMCNGFSARNKYHQNTSDS